MIDLDKYKYRIGDKVFTTRGYGVIVAYTKDLQYTIRLDHPTAFSHDGSCFSHNANGSKWQSDENDCQYFSENMITLRTIYDLNNKNMKNNEIKIQVPEGMEIDKENSTFECIKFKPKTVKDYDDISEELFDDKDVYYIGSFGTIENLNKCNRQTAHMANTCATKKQGEKLLAINKLINVAKYLNGDWKPNFGHKSHHLIRRNIFGGYDAENCNSLNFGMPVFKDRESALKAIEILGKETLDLIFGDY